MHVHFGDVARLYHSLAYSHKVVWFVQKDPKLKAQGFESFVFWVFLHDLNDLKVNMTRKFLLMKKVNLSVLISNFDIKLSKTEPFLKKQQFENQVSSQKKCPGIWVEFLDL